MHLGHRSLAGLVIATTAAAGMGMTGIATGTPHTSHSSTAAPTLTVTAAKGSFKVTGPTSFAAGTVDLVAKGTTAGAPFGVASFKGGYTLAQFKKDYASAQKGTKAGLKALDRAVAHTTFWGGVDADPGQTEKGSIVLPKAGTYYLAREGAKITHATKLTVTGPASTGTPVATSATVTANGNEQFGGSSTLPAKGTITFKNVSKGKGATPHFLTLLHVKMGTTKKDIEKYFASGSSKPPSFALKGDANTDVIGAGVSMTFSYKLPKGTYAELCFFPDLQTGVPHAFMGMIKVVTLH